MKRFVSLMLVLCCLLSGCSLFGERVKEPVTFYYVQQQYQFFTAQDVIAPEVREASGHREDLSYLLALYVMGPTDEALRSPLPRGSTVHSIQRTETEIILQMTDMDLTLSDGDFSLACACLAMTCMELTDVPAVTIRSGERTLTLNRESLVLTDESTNTKE